MTDQPSDATLERLLGPAGPELTCEECFEQLDRYVELELGTRADEQVPGHARPPRGLPGLRRGPREPARPRPQRSARVADPRAGAGLRAQPAAPSTGTGARRTVPRPAT